MITPQKRTNNKIRTITNSLPILDFFISIPQGRHQRLRASDLATTEDNIRT